MHRLNIAWIWNQWDLTVIFSCGIIPWNSWLGTAVARGAGGVGGGAHHHAVADGLPAGWHGPAGTPGGGESGDAPGGALHVEPAGGEWQGGAAAEARDGDGGDDDGWRREGDRPGRTARSLSLLHSLYVDMIRLVDRCRARALLDSTRQWGGRVGSPWDGRRDERASGRRRRGGERDPLGYGARCRGGDGVRILIYEDRGSGVCGGDGLGVGGRGSREEGREGGYRNGVNARCLTLLTIKTYTVLLSELGRIART